MIFILLQHGIGFFLFLKIQCRIDSFAHLHPEPNRSCRTRIQPNVDQIWSHSNHDIAPDGLETRFSTPLGNVRSILTIQPAILDITDHPLDHHRPLPRYKSSS